MRLHPPVTPDEAYEWLKDQVKRLPPSAQPEALEGQLRQLAADMAAISAIVVPDDVEPMFP